MDDVLFFGKLEKIIDRMIESLKNEFDLNVEDAQDPTCVKSRTGYLIQLGKVPVI